jgi:hypothetical protein
MQFRLSVEAACRRAPSVSGIGPQRGSVAARVRGQDAWSALGVSSDASTLSVHGQANAKNVGKYWRGVLTVQPAIPHLV